MDNAQNAILRLTAAYNSLAASRRLSDDELARTQAALEIEIVKVRASLRNRQAGAWLFDLILAGAALAAVGVVWYAVEHWCNAACKDARAEAAAVRDAWEVDKAERVNRTTEITLLLSGKLQTAMEDATKRERKTDATFEPITANVSRVARGRGVSLPRDIAGVLDDAARAGNAGRASPDAGTETRADAIPEAAASVTYDAHDLAEFFSAGPRAYADAFDLWHACRVREDAFISTLAKGAAHD